MRRGRGEDTSEEKPRARKRPNDTKSLRPVVEATITFFAGGALGGIDVFTSLFGGEAGNASFRVFDAGCERVRPSAKRGYARAGSVIGISWRCRGLWGVPKWRGGRRRGRRWSQCRS